MTDDLTYEERQQLKRDWAAAAGAREKMPRPDDPIGWLHGKRKPREGSWRGWSGWFDHGTTWTRNRRPFCLVGQPYDLSADDLAELHALAAEGFFVRVTTDWGWHNPGHVLFVTVADADAVRELNMARVTSNTIKRAQAQGTDVEQHTVPRTSRGLGCCGEADSASPSGYGPEVGRV